MKATLKTHRQSPRKVRLVADAIRGKSVPAALAILAFLGKRGAPVIEKLLRSAVANSGADTTSLKDVRVREIRVDKGRTLHRRMPRARGRAAPIKKRTSHIAVVLENRKG